MKNHDGMFLRGFREILKNIELLNEPAKLATTINVHLVSAMNIISAYKAFETAIEEI